MTSLAFCNLVLGWAIGPWLLEGYYSKFALFNSEQGVELYGEVPPKKKLDTQLLIPRISPPASAFKATYSYKLRPALHLEVWAPCM